MLVFRKTVTGSDNNNLTHFFLLSSVFFIREVKFDVYGKRQTANFCRLSSALCTVESRYLYLQ